MSERHFLGFCSFIFPGVLLSVLSLCTQEFRLPCRNSKLWYWTGFFIINIMFTCNIHSHCTNQLCHIAPKIISITKSAKMFKVKGLFTMHPSYCYKCTIVTIKSQDQINLTSATKLYFHGKLLLLLIKHFWRSKMERYGFAKCNDTNNSIQIKLRRCSCSLSSFCNGNSSLKRHNTE